MGERNRRAVRWALGLGLVLALGCATDGGGEGGLELVPIDPAPYTSSRLEGTDADFHFVIVSDRTGGHRPGVFEGALERVNLLKPAFVVSVGDLIEGYTADRAALEREWDEIEGFVDRLEMPFFYAAGNHDFSNETMSQVWRERFGPSYYHFRYRDVLFLVLNSELFDSVARPGAPVPGPDRQEEQLRFAERVLAEHDDARFTFVVIHQPLWDGKEVHADWLRVEDWLGARHYSVVAGHHHRYTSIRRHDRRFVTLGSTGGTSRLRGIDHGEFDHVLWVSMTEDGPVYANLMLDGIHDIDVRTEATRRLGNRLGNVITALPWFVEEERFRAGEAVFALRNPHTEPIEVLAELRAGRDLVPGVPAARIVLGAGARERFVVPVTARAPTPVGALAPAWIDWTVRAAKGNGEPTELVARSWILPDREFRCAEAPAAVTVDGRLAEWGALPHAIAARPGPPGSSLAPGAETASLRFEVACGETELYIIGEVVDPTPFADEDRVARDQDSVSFLLDARAAAERNVNENFYAARRNGSLMGMLQTWIAPGDTRPDPIVGHHVPELPEGVRRAATRNEAGYGFELAVPYAWLDERGGGTWDGFRLDLGLLDFDREGVPHLQQEWRPSRLSVEGTTPAAGSGSFLRR